MRKITCAGCNQYFYSSETVMYRKKRCCGSESCVEVIDEKVKKANYKRKMQRIENGKFRNGVTKEIRETILQRDNNRCKLCHYRHNEPYMMQVHHIVPVSNGGDDSHENLCSLCKPCHMKVHSDGWEYYVNTLKKDEQKVGR